MNSVNSYLCVSVDGFVIAAYFVTLRWFVARRKRSFHTHTHAHTNRLTHTQTDSHTHTLKQTHTHIHTHAHRQTDTDISTDRQTHAHTHTPHRHVSPYEVRCASKHSQKSNPDGGNGTNSYTMRMLYVFFLTKNKLGYLWSIHQVYGSRHSNTLINEGTASFQSDIKISWSRDWKHPQYLL